MGVRRFMRLHENSSKIWTLLSALAGLSVKRDINMTMFVAN